MRGLVSTILVLGLIAGGPPARSDGGTGTVAGRVELDGIGRPPSGARVHLADRTRGVEYVSEPVEASGGFVVGGLPAAEYAVAVELDGALYVAPGSIAVEPGRVRAVSVAVRTGPALAPGNVWDSNLGSGLLVVGGAILLGWALEEMTKPDRAEETASPFAP